MSTSPKYFDPQTLASLQTLTLRARHVVDGYMAGLHRSPTRGFSIEFAEHRQYVPGDDLRYVDWKIFGRTDKLHLKQFEDETNLQCYLVVDTSESMHYRGPNSAWSKFDHVACTAVSLAWLILQQQDAVGLATFDDRVRDWIPPSNKPSQNGLLIQHLETVVPHRKTSLGPILHELAERFRRRGLVILLSDLLDNVDQFSLGLKHLRHQRHDVIVIHCLDAAEVDFPFQRSTRFRGLEAESSILVDPRSVRKAYLEQVTMFRSEVERRCLEQQIDYWFVRSDERLDVTLARILARRNRRSS